MESLISNLNDRVLYAGANKDGHNCSVIALIHTDAHVQLDEHREGAQALVSKGPEQTNEDTAAQVPTVALSTDWVVFNFAKLNNYSGYADLCTPMQTTY